MEKLFSVFCWCSVVYSIRYINYCFAVFKIIGLTYLHSQDGGLLCLLFWETKSQWPYWIIKNTKTCARGFIVAILVCWNNRTEAILDYISMLKLLIWRHSSHIWLRNKDKTAILDYSKFMNYTCDVLANTLVSWNNRTASILDYINMFKLFIRRHRCHTWLRDKDKTAILNYSKLINCARDAMATILVC